MKDIKNILWGIFAIVMVVICAVLFLNDDLEHIEDTNGADDYSLTTITDENIINMDTGSIGGPKISKGILNGNMVEFSADKFTGVYEILYDNLIGSSDFTLSLSSFTVNSGNFKMVVVHDNEIVATLEPDTFVDYSLEDVSGNVSLIIAGESASFNFSMSETDYDLHSHS